MSLNVHCQPTKSPKAIELCTGLDLLPSVVTQPPITQARKPKDSSSNASFRRSLAISTVSGRAADVEDTGTYTAPSSPDDDGWKAQKAQRAAGPPSPNLPMKSSLRPRVHSNTPSRSRTGSSASSTITAHTRIPPVPSFSPSATYRQAVSSADLPPIAQGKVKVTEPSTSSGGTRTLACLYLVAGLPKECVYLPAIYLWSDFSQVQLTGRNRSKMSSSLTAKAQYPSTSAQRY